MTIMSTTYENIKKIKTSEQKGFLNIYADILKVVKKKSKQLENVVTGNMIFHVQAKNQLSIYTLENSSLTETEWSWKIKIQIPSFDNCVYKLGTRSYSE